MTILFLYQIHLDAMIVPPGPEPGIFSPMVSCFPELGCKKVLEDCTSQGMEGQIRWGADIKQVAQQAGIKPVQLWRFDQTLVEAFVPWSHHEYQECRLQKAEPVFNRVHCKTGILGKGLQIEQLPGQPDSGLSPA